MIKIDRRGVSAPPSLTEDEGAGPKETRRNKKRFEDYLASKAADSEGAEGGLELTFAAYGRQEVRQALVALSHGKCAYCEKRFAATQPVDVEHWRPKGRVELEDGSKIPGYFWLAADWDNLLPSCIDCNRARYHEAALSAETERLGKQNQFPLWREEDRWTDPSSPCKEVPLLLHPYSDDPSKTLAFSKEGVARPRGESEPVSGPTDKERAEASIRVYALNRPELVNERKALLWRIERMKLTIVRLMQVLEELTRLQDQEEADFLRQLVEQLLDQELEELSRLMDPASEFAGMARQRIEAFWRQIDPKS